MTLKLPGPYRGLSIGLFGGSFNPAHEGHFHVAETALRRLRLDHVWWLVARGNPLKERHGVFEARLASARRLAGGHPHMQVSTLEDDLGVHYTRELLTALLPRTPGARFVWIMGADNLAGFHRWDGWDEIAVRIPIAIVARPGASPKAGLSKFAQRYGSARLPEHSATALPFARPPAWTVLIAPWHPASSTALRRHARARNPFRGPRRERQMKHA